MSCLTKSHMLNVAIKKAVKLHRPLLGSGWDILVSVVTDEVKLFVMSGLVCLFIDSAGIPAADGSEMQGIQLFEQGSFPPGFDSFIVSGNTHSHASESK